MSASDRGWTAENVVEIGPFVPDSHFLALATLFIENHDEEISEYVVWPVITSNPVREIVL